MRIKLNLFFILFLFSSYYFDMLTQSIIVFTSVLAHELGHILTARILRIKVEEIELFPFGGVARMEDLSKYGGYTEAVIAAAGPVTSGIIAFLCLVLNGNSLFKMGALYNFLLMVFNLVPALPLDGGRIVRNLLIASMSYKAATKKMVITGRVLSILLVFYNIYLIQKGSIGTAYLLLGIFIYMGTVKELKYCSYFYLLNLNNRKNHRIKHGKIKKRYMEVNKNQYIRVVTAQFSQNSYCTITVADNGGKVLKVLNEADIMDGFLKFGYDGTVEQIIKEK